MRTAIVLLPLLLAPAATGSDLDPLDLLAALCDEARPETARGLEAALLARLPGSLPLLEALDSRVGTEPGKAVVERLFEAAGETLRERLGSGDRETILRSFAPVAKRLSGRTRWRLGADVDGAGKAVLWFRARTFVEPARRGMLEYLVCPEDPGGKAYECLAGMSTAEWSAFSSAFEPGAAISLRWFDPEGEMRTAALPDLLPWARASLVPGSGLLLGGNHDERGNARLPGDGLPIRIGIAIG